MVLSCVVSKLAQLAQCVIGSIHGRWCRNPQYVLVDFYVVLSFVFGRLKYIPFSNKLHLVFPCDKTDEFWCNYLWKQWMDEQDGRSLDPTSIDIAVVLPVLVKIVQALNDGLRLQNDCRVSAYVPKGYKRMQGEDGVVEGVVVSRFAKERDSADNLQIVSSNDKAKKIGLKYNTDHLDGLNWELMVVRSEGYNAYYLGNGRIVFDTSWLYSVRSEAELANILAPEVGHGVAMHCSEFAMALWPFALIPWPSSFLYAAILRLSDLIFYSCRRREHEADYTGLMLMASAGYDPRQVPQFYAKSHNLSEYFLDTTQPSSEKRAQALMRPEAMDRAVKIYEQVRAGQGVPSFV